jgi:pimeloyl-ACP methyl ester carboxylesterase
MYQIFMRPGTTEYALLICFDQGFYSRVTPLGHPEKLNALSIPVSFFYGEDDWVRRVDKEGGKAVVEASPHKESQYHIVTNSDHNMHMDNPTELANLIINDIFADANLPVGFAPEEKP